MNIDEYQPSLSTFGRRGLTVVPSDSTDLPVGAKAITVLEAGSLAFVPLDNDDGDSIAYEAVQVGFIAPFLVRRVLATGTTATVAAIYD